MIGNLINSAGGRGFVFAIVAFIFTAVMLYLKMIDGAQWLEYNKMIGLGFMGAKAFEGGADALAKKKSGD